MIQSVELHPEVRASPETLVVLVLLQYPLASDLVSPVDSAPTSGEYRLRPGVRDHPLHLGPGGMYQVIRCTNSHHIYYVAM